MVSNNGGMKEERMKKYAVEKYVLFIEIYIYQGFKYFK